MKKRNILLALICALTLCFALALAGCGSKADYTKNFAGEWEISGMTEAGVEYSSEDIQLMKDWGLNVVLTLSEDKTASFDLFGEKTEGTWEPKSEKECTITMEGDTITAKLDNGTLTLADDDYSMSFQKAESK
ncbi:MAG: hypothetical protein ACI4BI_06940 [Anaerotardibacter sp.]